MVGSTSVTFDVADAETIISGFGTLVWVVDTCVGSVCVLQPKSNNDSIVINMKIRIVLLYSISRATARVTGGEGAGVEKSLREENNLKLEKCL